MDGIEIDIPITQNTKELSLTENFGGIHKLPEERRLDRCEAFNLHQV
jgi:hypothetical protein